MKQIKTTPNINIIFMILYVLITINTVISYYANKNYSDHLIHSYTELNNSYKFTLEIQKELKNKHDDSRNK